MSVVFDVALLALLVVAASVTLGLLVTVVHIGRDRWKEAASLSGSTSTVLKGEVETDRDGLRDPRVSKGKVWDKATQHWRSQGKLSDEYVKNMVA